MFDPPTQSEPQQSGIPATRTFVATRYVINTINGRQIRSESEVVDEVVDGHNIAVEAGGVVAIVEMVDIGEGRAMLQYRAIFAPGEFVCIREARVTAPSRLVRPN